MLGGKFGYHKGVYIMRMAYVTDAVQGNLGYVPGSQVYADFTGVLNGTVMRIVLCIQEVP